MYNDQFCYDIPGKRKILPEQASLYKERVSNIFKFLDSTDEDTKYYKVLHKKDKKKIIGSNKALGAELTSKFKFFVFIGMGGAILNPMMVRSFCGNNKLFNHTFFINSPDPLLIQHVLANVKLKDTCFIPISNSGETTETIAVMNAFIKKMQDERISNFHENFVCITSHEESTLYKTAHSHNMKIVRYDPDVGGRFSTFSNSAILPGAIMGLDLDGYLDGANSVIEEFWKNRENSVPVHAALTILLSKRRILPIFTYYSEFMPFLQWYAQIISESLGKNKVGYAPFYGICPMEQHAAYQYFLDGGDDSLITMISGENNLQRANLSKYASLNEINQKFFQSSITYMKQQDIPVRTFKLANYNPYSFGQLIMHCTIEIVFLSLLHEFHPFNQPAMDDFKKFTLSNYFA